MKKLVMMGILLFSVSILGSVPAIMVKPDSSKPSVPLGIKKIDINVDVVKNLATTTMKIVFYNDLDRVLEGDFYFPLPENSMLSHFALEVNGKLRDGVVVEKEKGQQVFESVVRQQIDPGLLEWTKGNNFKSRIYPIPAKGTKELSISYEQELKKSSEGFNYTLPLSFKDKMELFSITITAHNQKVQPILPRKKDMIRFLFKKDGDKFITKLVEENYVPSKAVSFFIPHKEDNVILTEKVKKDNFFYLNTAVDIIEEKKKLPENLCIIWDGSGSAAKKNIDNELKLIDTYISMLKDPKISLWVLRNDLEKTAVPSVNKLKEKIKSIKYDGGTQLGALKLNTKEFNKCDEIILSTDGVSNFGSSDVVFGKSPIITLNSKTTAEHSVLNYISKKSGGVYINLDSLSEKEAELLLTKAAFQFIKAEYNNSEITETYPSVSTPVTSGFSMSGKLLSEKGEIKLHFGIGSDIKTTKTFVIEKDKNNVNNNIIARTWVKKKINELDQQPKKYEKELVRLGKKYSIVTRYTSLIVLDRLEDYITHKIVPPKELQDEYFKIVENQKKTAETTLQAHLDDLYTRYSEMVKYWNRKFEWNPPVFKKLMKKMAESDGASASALSGREEAVRSTRSPRRNLRDFANEAESDSAPQREMAMDKKETKADSPAEGGIELAKWNPDTPYLKKLKEAKKNHYELYLTLRKDYENSSAFYLDVADFFVELNQKELALRILSNIAEMELQNHQLLRILAHRLAQLKYYDLAIYVFHDVLNLRKEEPQSYRDLGLTYALNNQPQKAVDYLYEVISRKWDSRFSDIDVITLHELNAVIALNPTVDYSKVQKRFIKNLDTDIRVVLNWDADNSDMDLWVTDPNGEKCFYSHKKTFIGGWMSNDFTQGYGPEAFWLKRAKPGEYKIEVNYYGNRQQVLSGSTTIQIQLFLNYGRKSQLLKEITMRLKDKTEVVQAGTFKINAAKDGKIGFSK